MRLNFLQSASRFNFQLGFALLATISIGGCDSGGGSTPTPPSRPNTPPQALPTSYFNVNENVTGVIHTVDVKDLEGDPLTFAITGGPDADKFTVAANGDLSFRTSPDFEAPTDANADNIYVFVVTISDGKASVEQIVAVTVQDVTTGNFRVRKVATGLSQATAIQPVPGDADHLFVTEKTGRVRIVAPGTGTIAATPFLDVGAEINTDGNRGLTAFAPAPDFAQSHIVYAALTTKAGELEIRRYRTRTGDNGQIDPASADTILRAPNPDSELVGGWIGFGQDGMLYISIGDPTGTGQDRANLFGKILRVDVSSDQFPADPDRDYAIPADNPFASDARTPEIWVIGMRHPYGGSFDPVTGSLWINDYGDSVGRNFLSDVNLVRVRDKGANYYWNSTANIPDGYNYPMLRVGFGLTPPDKTRGILIPGQVYRGPIEPLQGRYIFDRIVSSTYGWFQAIGRYVFQSANIPNGNSQSGLEAATRPSTGFGRDAANNLYIANSAGDLFIVEPS